MRQIVALLFTAVLIGCNSHSAADADPPPGVRKNENRNPGGASINKSKPTLIEKGKKKS